MLETICIVIHSFRDEITIVNNPEECTIEIMDAESMLAFINLLCKQERRVSIRSETLKVEDDTEGKSQIKKLFTHNL
jgi:hypothetical protein